MFCDKSCHAFYSRNIQSSYIGLYNGLISLFLLIQKSAKKSKKKAEQAEDMSSGSDELFNPVKCDQCGTEIGVFDKDEVYHFFNIMASHS